MDSPKVKIRIAGVWISDDDVKVLDALAKTGSWRECWRVLGRSKSGFVEDKLRLFNRLTGEKLWVIGTRPIEVNEQLVNELKEKFSEMSKIAREIQELFQD